jgi:hypothetical protein
MVRARARAAAACAAIVVAACALFAASATASPSYEKLVYEVGTGRSTDPSAGYEAFVNSSQVSTQQLLGSGTPGPHDLALSPNGQTVAFDRNGSIYTTNLNTHQEKLVYSSTCSNGPRFTPDGKALFFNRNCDSRTFSDIWRVNVDGTSPTAVIAWGNQQMVSDVSADGRLIAFSSNADNRGKLLANYNVWVANADGSSPRQVRPLTSQPYNTAMNPSFTPDATKIAFAGFVSGVADLFVANTDGTGSATDLTGTSSVSENNPRWSPDATSLCATRITGSGTVNEQGGIALYSSLGSLTAQFGIGAYGQEALGCSYRQASSLSNNDYLAAQFMPMLEFDHTEKWRPVNAAMFLSEKDPATGQPWHQICSATLNCSGLAGELTLGSYSTSDSYISIHRNANSDPDSYTSPTATCNQVVNGTSRHDCDTGPASAIYYHVVGPSPSNYTYIDYWFFYRYDQGFDNVGNHAGDWEGVTVAPSTTGNTFQFAEFSQHGGWYSFLRDNLQCDSGAGGSCGSESGGYSGQHVMTFPAAGSHANYSRQNSSGTFDGGNDGAAPWGRDLDTNSTGTCPANVPASPPNVCGPALVPFPATGAQRWTDWAGRWGETVASGVGGSNSPTSPAGANPPDHGPHFFAPWSGASCDSGAACPASAHRREPLSCHNWLGGGVAAVACNQPHMRRALRSRHLGRKGTFTLRLITQRRRAATAPGLAQVLGHPLSPGEQAEVSGTIPRGTELLVRAGAHGRFVTAVFDRVGPLHGRAKLLVRRGRGDRPLVVLVRGHSRVKPTRTIAQPAGARQGW